MDCVVIKPFIGNGLQHERNMLVDASAFRNADALISNRYLRVASADEIASAYEEPAPGAAEAEASVPQVIKLKPKKKAALTLRRKK